MSTKDKIVESRQAVKRGAMVRLVVDDERAKQRGEGVFQAIIGALGLVESVCAPVRVYVTEMERLSLLKDGLTAADLLTHTVGEDADGGLVIGPKAERPKMTILKFGEMVSKRVADKGTGCSRVFDLSLREVRHLAEEMVANHHTVGPAVLLAIAVGDVVTFAGQQIRVVPVSKRELAQSLGVNEDVFSVEQMLEKIADLSDHRDRVWGRLDNARAEIHELEVKLEREQLKTADSITRRELERALQVEPDSFTMAQLIARVSNQVGDLERAHANVHELAAQKLKAGRERAAVEREQPKTAPLRDRLAQLISNAVDNSGFLTSPLLHERIVSLDATPIAT